MKTPSNKEVRVELTAEVEAEVGSWNEVPGSTGRRAPTVPLEDEDAEGLSESAQLVEQGVDKAEQEQMAQAARDARRQERDGSDIV